MRGKRLFKNDFKFCFVRKAILSPFWFKKDYQFKLRFKKWNKNKKITKKSEYTKETSANKKQG